MKKLKLLFIFIIFFSNFTCQLKAQDFDEIKRKMEREFDAFKQQNQHEYDQYIIQTDAEFAQYLDQIWEEFTLSKGIKPSEAPKPKVVPNFTPSKIEDVPLLIPVSKPPIADQMVLQPRLPIPALQKTEDLQYEQNTIQFQFYGSELSFNYDSRISVQIEDTVDNTSISSYWTKMCETNYPNLIDKFKNIKTNLNLNDWGYYLLLKNFSKQLFPSSLKSENLLTWYLLTRSGYKARIAYADNNDVFILIASTIDIYNVNFLNYNNLRYYLLDSKETKVRTYDKDFPDAHLVMDLNIDSPLNLAEKIGNRKVNFRYRDKKYNFSINYNKNLVDFYNDYPQAQISVYFDAMVSRAAKESIIDSLYPLMKDKPETEAAEFLLNFVQNAFDYKTDEEQFSHEKFFFVEDVLHYPFCDCEDRAVFYAFLVKELLKHEVVGIEYPGHMSTAVHFDQQIEGDEFVFQNKTFTVCDPTYIDAPIGEAMPDFENVSAKIIPLKNQQNKDVLQKSIWEKTLALGCNRANNKRDIIVDSEGNSYLTGFFSGEVNFGSFSIQTDSNKKEIFVAKYDKNGIVQWAKQGRGKGSNVAYDIALDKHDGCIITGSFNDTLIFENKVLPANSNGDIFLAKFASNGDVLWVAKTGFDTIERDTFSIFVAEFTEKGEFQDTKLYKEDQNFTNYGIAVDSLNNIYVTGSFANSMGLNVSKVSYASMETFNPVTDLKTENDKLISEHCDKSIAGLFAIINVIKSNNAVIAGKSIQAALDKNNPLFRIKYVDIYNNISKINIIKNSDGIIFIINADKNPVCFGKIKVENNAKIKIINYQNGNAQIDVLSNIKVGKSFIWYPLNYIKLFRANGDLLFDYDDDHTQVKLNLRNDILN
jgi:hypothetical protein